MNAIAPALLGMIMLLASLGCNPNTQPSSNPSSDSIPEATPQQTVSMTLDAKDFIKPDTVKGIPWKAGFKVADAVKASQGMRFALKEYAGMGHLVTSINGLENEAQAGHYWQFCVDGVFSDQGIDEKQLEAGQVVNWYYRAYGEGPCKKIGE